MIIVKLKGNLGNQMFQYAVGKILMLKFKDTLKFDVTSIKYNYLTEFNIDICEATQDEIDDMKHQKILHNNFEFSEYQGNVYLDGFFQDIKYFPEEYRNILLNDFTLKHYSDECLLLKEQIINNDHTVSITFRRGDYLAEHIRAANFGICTLNYYQKCINILQNLLNTSKMNFIISSDQLEFAKTHLDKCNIHNSSIVFINAELSPCEKIYLLSLYQHHIMANSSFSWWSSYLCIYPKKYIFIPEPWFNFSKYNLAFETYIKQDKEF